MADLATLITTEIPEGRHNLSDSHTNLERVAEYCEGNYFQAENKRVALEETKNYTTQSLASVAYQINTLAYNFLQMLDLQAMQLAEMESQMNHIAQTVMIHKEKVARREIGILTANKTITRQYKILAPSNPEKPIKYVRKAIDYSALDDIGHGVKMTSSTTPRQKRGSSQGSVQGLILQPASAVQSVGPAPTTKPPTPPQPVRVGGSLSKGSREYRTPPAVAPPQVPSHYAPNYPLGHPRRGERGSGYSTLPLPHSHGNAPTSPPQVGMVHPIPHGQLQAPHPQTPPPPPPTTTHNTDQLGSMPPPPSPLPMSGMSAVDFEVHHPGNSSPPLPPPPPDGEHHGFGAGDRIGQTRQPGIMPVEEDLPGWVPKNYIEKVVAIYDYYADKDDELSFQENAVIYVLKKNDDGWWEGVMDGITGLFPGNYVEPCV